MYCENCGKEIEEGTRFCKHCGVLIGYTIEREVSERQHEKISDNPIEDVRVETVVEPGVQEVSSGLPQRSKAITVVLASAVGIGAIVLLILLTAIMFHYKRLSSGTSKNWLRDFYENSYDDDSYDEDSYGEDDFFDGSDNDDFSGGKL